MVNFAKYLKEAFFLLRLCSFIDDARLKILNSNDGLNPIINLIKSINEQEISIDEEFLLIVVLGCLHNISNENGKFFSICTSLTKLCFN